MKSMVVARFKLCIDLTVTCSVVPNFLYTETVGENPKLTRRYNAFK